MKRLISILVATVITPVLSVIQTETLDVYLSDASSASGNQYSILLSQGLFGKGPSMDTTKNPKLKLVRAPDDNPLLCQNITKTDLTTDLRGSMMLVPRGTCTFETKALHAQQLGSSGILVYGNLASRYDLNRTGKPSDYQYSEADIQFPSEFYDYDCSKGRAMVPKSALSFDPLPYNPSNNDPLLSESGTENVCLFNSEDKLSACPSKACLLTGKSSTVDGEENMEVCCAWDLHIWLYPDEVIDRNKSVAVTIPAAYITMQQAQQLFKAMEQNSIVSVVLSLRWRPQYNPALFLIWALGVAVAALAAYLSAGDYRKHIRKLRRRQERDNTREPRNQDGLERTEQSPSATVTAPPDDMELTAAHALGFIVMASSSLLILFYFKIYGVVKVFYAFGCSKAVSQVIADPLVKRVMKTWKKPNQIIWRTGTEDFGDITLRDIVSHLIGYSLGLSWLIIAFTIQKPESLTYFWVMQDVFGTCMCIMFLQVIKLNSIRVASILLIVAFFYDIFFVFITPLLFKGKSVMITVATSGGPPTAGELWCEKYPTDENCQGGDPLPMLLTIPRLLDFTGGSSLLGLGDIVLPGLLLSLAARFDAAKRMMGIIGGGSGNLACHACPERRYCFGCSLCSGGYFAPMVIAYAVGLLMANAAVQLMEMGQPALLYLVPSCLGTMCFMGWRRDELKELWDEPKAVRSADNIIYGEFYSGTSPTTPSAHMPLAQEEGGSEVSLIPSASDMITATTRNIDD